MARVEVDMLTGHPNYALLRLPGRRHPGVLFPGETLSALADDIDGVLCLLRDGATTDAETALAAVAAHLASLRAAYVDVLDAAQVPLPFARPA